MPRSALPLTLACLLVGCGFGADEGRGHVERVLVETPRIAAFAFALAEPPVSTYNQDGKYPDWIGSVRFARFEWKQVSKQAYLARATVTLEPGPKLRALQPPVDKPAELELSVSFLVHQTPPPIVFLPGRNSLVPTQWRITKLDGRTVSEGGSAADYRTEN